MGRGRPKKNEPTEQLRLPLSLVKRVRRVANHLDEVPGEYIAKRIEGQLSRDEKKMLADLEAELNRPND